MIPRCLQRCSVLSSFYALRLVAGWVAASSSLYAAPVTFGFKATISDVRGDAAALNLPFTLAVGQQIKGNYSFQSEEDLLDIFLHHERGKQGLVTLTIDGTEMEAATNFGLLNSAGVLDPPITGPTSSIFLDYISPTDVFPGWPASIAGRLWRQQLILLGTDGTITEPEQLLDAGVWNQLTLLRRVELQFGYPDSVVVQAAVADFVVVPEPSSAGLICMLIAIGLTTFLGRKKVPAGFAIFYSLGWLLNRRSQRTQRE